MTTYTYTTFVLRGGLDTYAEGINDSGEVVGEFLGVEGFVESGGAYTTIDFPGSGGNPPRGHQRLGRSRWLLH